MNIWHILLLTGLFVLAALLGFGAILLINQSRFVYFPDLVLAATPAELGLDYREISFAASDGVRLHGWLIPSEASKAVVLFCHGNGGNISYLLETIDIFHHLGYTTFIFDYRGYGKSEGTRPPHSRDDEIVPFSHGQRLFAAAGEPKTFLPIHGDHNNHLRRLRGQ